MPKRSASLKSSSKSYSGRRHSLIQNSVKPVPQHVTGVASVPSFAQPSSSSTSSSSFSLPSSPEASTSIFSGPESDESPSFEVPSSASPSVESMAFSSPSTVKSLIIPSSPFLSASPSPSLRFSSTTTPDPLLSLNPKSSAIPLSPSSSLSPPSVLESQQTLSTMGAFAPNSSIQHDALYEYVKGLQEAIKGGDANCAERLLQELGELANSPAAVSLIVSANGTRLIATAVRQFRWHGLQKPAKGSMKGGRAGSSKTSLSAKQLEADLVHPSVRSGESENDHSDDGFTQLESCHSFGSLDHFDGNSLAVSPVEIVPTIIAAPNESRRKRQRTSGELEEEDDAKEGFTDEISEQSVRAECSSQSVGKIPVQLSGGTGEGRSNLVAAAMARTLGKHGSECPNVEDAPKLVAARVVRIRGRYTRIVRSRNYTRDPLKVNDLTEMSESIQSSFRPEISGKDAVLARESGLGVVQDGDSSRNESELDELSQERALCLECSVLGNADSTLSEETTNSGGTGDPVKGSDIRSVDAEERFAEQTSTSPGIDLISISISSPDCTKGGGSEFRSLSRPPNKKLQVGQSAIGLQTVLAQTYAETGSADADVVLATNEAASPSGQSNEGENLENVPLMESASSSHERGIPEFTSVSRNHRRRAGRASVDVVNKGASPKPPGVVLFGGAGKLQASNMEDNRLTSKWSGESIFDKKANQQSGGEEKTRETSSIYSLAKGTGMPDVVAEGCNALDKLATTAFRGAAVGGKMASVTGVAAAKRGKTFSAEMYVALTETFVDLLQVLKDNGALLSWCLGCLGNILPPGSGDRNSSDSFLSIPASSKGPYVTNKEHLKVTCGKGVKHDGSHGGLNKQQSARNLSENQLQVKEKDSKSLKESTKLATASYAAAALSAASGKGSGNLTSTCSGLASESTASSISALAAVAYAATVPMLAEKAVKAILNAMQSCDIEAHSTHSALRALSAHLLSTNSKYVCDDAVAFIIAAMREFVSDVEMQAESCIALVSLPRAVSSATGHAAWAAVTVSMDHHRSNLVVQRAGCGTLQLLCTRTGLGVPEWGSGKRPLRAVKDADRETGARALIAAMVAFPEDVRIQWHGCSTLWTLVHSAGVRSVANMVRYGAVAAVVGAMSVCRINELMQQEGCNVLGTLARTFAENGHDVGPLICPLVPDALKIAGPAGPDQMGISGERIQTEATQKSGSGAGKRRASKDEPPTSPDNWWSALWAVVSAMKAFNKSKSLQSNGTFALGCILKGSGENFHVTSGVSPMPGMPVSNSKPSETGLGSSRSGMDLFGKSWSERGRQSSNKGVSTDGSCSNSTFPHSLPDKDVVDDLERIDAAFEVTMTAMREFSKVETVQVWGCAVLQQAFLAYVHYAKRLAPVSIGVDASVSAALSAPNGASVFSPLAAIVRSPSSIGNTDFTPNSSGFPSSSAFPPACTQSKRTVPKTPLLDPASKSLSSKLSTDSKSSLQANSWLFPATICSPAQRSDISLVCDGGGTGQNHSSRSLDALQSTLPKSYTGQFDGRTTPNGESPLRGEETFTTYTPKGSRTSTESARSPVPVGCTPTISHGESSGAGRENALVTSAAPKSSAQKSPSKVLSFSSPSYTGSSGGVPCTQYLLGTGPREQKSQFNSSRLSRHHSLGSPPLKGEFGRFSSPSKGMQHSASSPSQPISLVALPSDLANLILVNATKAMKIISKTMKLSCSATTRSSSQPQAKPGSGPQAGKSNPKTTAVKSLASRSPSVSVNHPFASVRQSWCAALGAIGDVFGHLTRSSEVALGQGVPRSTDFLEIYKDRKHMHQYLKHEQPSDRNGRFEEKDDNEETEMEQSDDETEANVTLNSITVWTHTMGMYESNSNQCSSDAKAYMDAVVQQYKDKEKVSSKGKRTTGSCQAKDMKKDTRCSTEGDVDERSNGTSDWSTLDSVSQQQAVKDIKAWQEATEAMGRIAERAGFCKAVKKSILAIRKLLGKLEDAETIIWACHALVSLHLTWENVHLSRAGVEIDREEFKSKIWGSGEVGVLQLVELVVHWTNQNRLDVTSLALQALYSACVFAATVQEIEEVFGPGEIGAAAVLGAMQKALSSGGTAHQRRKVIQQACCVLTTVCGYSIRAQVSIAAACGADVILAALDRYDEDNQIQVNGMHALGLDPHLQPGFDILWNAALCRTAPGGVKWSRRRKGSSTSGATLIGLTHIYKEGMGLPSDQTVVNESGSPSDRKGENQSEGLWTPQLERLLFDGRSQLGLFRTSLIASPGCGGPAFAVELFKRLTKDAQSRQNVVEMQVHVCLVIGYMTAHDSKWRREFIHSGAVEAVLAAMEFLHKQNHESIVTSFGLMCDGVEVGLDARIDPRDLDAESRPKVSSVQASGSSRVTGDTSPAEHDEGLAIRDILEAQLQCAASWALAGLVKDTAASTSHSTLNIIQALAVALLKFGMSSFKPESARAEKVHAEVCTPARLALARLGVFRIGTREQGRILPHDAAAVGDVTCLETLANKGVDLLMIDSQGQTALMCAERAGQTAAVQYLRDYAQLKGKRKAREKAKAKNKQGARKTKSLDQTEIPHEKAKSYVEVSTGERLNPMEVQDQPSSFPPGTAGEELAKSARIAGEDIREDRLGGGHRSVLLSGSSIIEAASSTLGKQSSEDMSPKVKTVDGADSDAGPGSFTSVENPPSAEERMVEIKVKGKEKKAIKGLKVRDVKESQEGSMLNSRRSEKTRKWVRDPNTGGEGHVNPVIVGSRHNIVSATETKEETPTAHRAKAEKSPAGRSSDAQEIEKLNAILREAMLSGDVENLQSALGTCASSGHQADESLVKKVKAGLTKRLKRMGKATLLQEKLSAATKEGDCVRLREAILEIERVPRFSLVFKSQLESATILLFELESKEGVLDDPDTQAVSDRSSNLDEVHSIWSEENIEVEEDSTGRASEWSFVDREEKVVVVERDEREGLTYLNGATMDALNRTNDYKGKQRKEKGNELSAGSLPYFPKETKEKGVCRKIVRKAHVISNQDAPLSTLVQVTAAANDSPAHGRRPHEYSDHSLFAADPLTSLLSTANSQSIPPLLPFPAHASIVSPVLQPSRSVIMPPRSSGRALYSPSGHEPITPQLFPVAKGGSVDHYNDQRWGGHFTIDSSEESPIGSHMARMFASQWSSPYTFQQELQSAPDKQVEQSALTSDSSDSLATFLASIFQLNFSRSSFSTLFSTSFGETPTPRTASPYPGSGVKVQTASPLVRPLLATQGSNPMLNVHA